MGATAKWFMLLLGESEDALFPIFSRAIDVIGSLHLAFLFSKIDEHLAVKSAVAVKADGSLRTRGGVALQILKQHRMGSYIFGGDARKRMADLAVTMEEELVDLRSKSPPTPICPQEFFNRFDALCSVSDKCD